MPASARHRFSKSLLAALRDGKIVRIKAGRRHRFIGIWGVVVGERLFVRSWSVKARGWYRTFLRDPRGFIEVGKRAISVRAVRTRSSRLNAAVDRAYLKKYGHGWELKFAKDMVGAKSRATTVELRPRARAAA
jgi:hypothetical protein